MELVKNCMHHDDEFKYTAYKITYLLLFPVAFLCNIGALVVFFMQRSRRSVFLFLWGHSIDIHSVLNLKSAD